MAADELYTISNMISRLRLLHAGYLCVLLCGLADWRCAADTLLGTYSGGGTYTTPTGTQYIVIWAWGAGGNGRGPSERFASGGNGGFIQAGYLIGAGQSI